MSNIGLNDINASIDGFIEIKYLNDYQYTDENGTIQYPTARELRTNVRYLLSTYYDDNKQSDIPSSQPDYVKNIDRYQHLYTILKDQKVFDTDGNFIFLENFFTGEFQENEFIFDDDILNIV